ncbi:hypothetical protein OAI07_01985 [Akkermansiaceae bacterium]|nr:hypothetical protein [Akkermansiaceae bacterium]
MFLCATASLTEVCFAEELIDLESYPIEDNLIVTLDEGLITPANLIHYRGTSETEITIFKEHKANLKKGEHWATIDKQRLDFEEDSLKLSRRRFSQDMEQLQKKHKEAKKVNELEKEQLIKDRKKLASFIESEAMTEELLNRIQVGIDKLDKEIKSSKKDSSDEKMAELLDLEEKTLKLALDRSERDFERSQKRVMLRANFDGILELTHKIDEGVPPYVIESETGELFATISNSSYYEVKVSNKNPIFLRKNLSNLQLTIRVGAKGELIKASYKERRKQDIGSITKDIHIFEVDEDSVDLAILALDETRVCQIIERLDEGCYIIPKVDIALLKSKDLRGKGWTDLVKVLWPNAKLVAEGPYAVAVSTKP